MVRKVGGPRKKAKSKAKTHKGKTRRRISGTGDFSGIMQKAAGLVAGAIAARELNTLVVKMGVQVSPMISGLGQMAAGFILPKFIKGPWGQNIGDGMVANGGMVAIVSTGIITGTNDRMAYRINGVSNLNVINGTQHLPVVNGVRNLPKVSGPATRVNNQPNVSKNIVGGKMAHYI